MMQAPLFSICIPCFNHGRYIEETLKSVLNQDFEDFEIIVADNASTDDSREVVRSISDSRIRLIENRYNIGFAPNLQQVTRPARGQFLNLLSSDDLMGPGALSTYAKLIESHRAHRDHLVLMSAAYEVNSVGELIRFIGKRGSHLAPVRYRLPPTDAIEAMPLCEEYSGRDLFARCMQTLETAGSFLTVTYSRSLWVQVEGYNSTQSFNPDFHFVRKLLRLDPVVLFVNRPLYKYRSHELGQAAQQKAHGAIRYQLDQYNDLLGFDESYLAGTGVDPASQRRIYLERDCANHALLALVEGNWLFASRLLALAWATFPRSALKVPRIWALLGLLLLGPLGTAAAATLRRVYPPRDLPTLGDEV